MASFLNPNDPPQPQSGVYGWFLALPKGARCLYIGQAGKKLSAQPRGTLLRGVSELSRDIFSSDFPHYTKLDTDFVVGTAIRFFEDQVGHVFWEHLSDDPCEEQHWLEEYRPVIQKSDEPLILPQLKIKRNEGYWKLREPNIDYRQKKLHEAEEEVFNELKRLLSKQPLETDGAKSRTAKGRLEGVMMKHYYCPYLKSEVVMTSERGKHIAERHPDLLPEYREQIGQTLADPDEVRRSSRFGSARLFSRWYTDVRGGKHVVVVIVSGADANPRHWIITAYLARKLVEGDSEWRRA